MCCHVLSVVWHVGVGAPDGRNRLQAPPPRLEHVSKVAVGLIGPEHLPHDNLCTRIARLRAAEHEVGRTDGREGADVVGEEHQRRPEDAPEGRSRAATRAE